MADNSKSEEQILKEMIEAKDAPVPNSNFRGNLALGHNQDLFPQYKDTLNILKMLRENS